MTVEQLIAELQRMPPHLTVEVVLREVWMSGETGDYPLDLSEADARVVDRVLNRGSKVLIESR